MRVGFDLVRKIRGTIGNNLPVGVLNYAQDPTSMSAYRIISTGNKG